MNFLFDTSIDVNRRQFYVLAMGSCIGNLAGFIGNALIFGWNGTTIFCGICMLLMAAGSFIGIKKGQIRYASYLMIAVLSLVEFPTLYYIYQTGTIVYMVLAMVAIAIFYSNRKCNPVCRHSNCSRCGSSYFSLYETAGK